MKVFAGKYEDAIQLIRSRKFRVWEGGTLDVADHWVNAHLLRGQQSFAAGRFSAALADFEAAKTIPDNLPNDSDRGSGRSAEIAWWIGCAQEKIGNPEAAKRSWQVAAESAKPSRRRGGEGGLSERHVQLYFQALAKRKLGEGDDAVFRTLVETGSRAIQSTNSEPSVERPRDRRPANAHMALAHYVTGLGHLGLGEKDKAMSEFTTALQSAPDFLAAKTELTRMQ